MSQLPHDEQFELLAAGYFDEVLDDAGLAALKSLLHEDDRRVKRFAELAQLNQMIAAEIAYGQQAEKFGLNLAPNDNAATGALVELASLYEDDLQDPMNFAVWREEQAHKARADRFAVWRNRLMVGGAIAALIAVVGLLTVVLIGDDVPEAPITEQVTGDEPAGPVQPIERTERVVAVLTASHQALWATPAGNAAPAPGDALYAGERLALTQGFAEITIARGAIVILEAPATVELLDNNNALRLHTGKLVGICETESSKGFTVRTSHLDVTDLGTRFGVAIDDAGNTLAEVFEGSIRVDAREQSISGFASIEMVAGDVVAVDRAGARSEDDSLSDALFAGLREYAGEAVSQGVLGFSGDIQWIEKDVLLAGGAQSLPESDKVWICTEFKDYELPKDLAITMGRGHRYADLTEEQYDTIAKGTRISSYIVGFNPAQADAAALAKPLMIQGQVIFDRDIIGFIATDEHWKRFDELVYGDASGGLIQPAPGMMVEKRAEGDQLVIHPYRRKLDLRLDATDSPDLVRIIVLESPYPKKP